MQENIIFITDLVLSEKKPAGVWVYMDSLVKHLSLKSTLVGKGTTKPLIAGSDHLIVSGPVSNFKFHWFLFKSKKKISSNKGILHAQRPDFLYWWRNSSNKKLVTLHGNPRSILKSKSFRHILLYNYMEKAVLKKVDKIIFIDRQTMDEYRLLYPKLTHKFAHIPSGVDTQLFFPEKIDKEFFLYLGRFAPEKQIDLIIKSYKNVLTKFPLKIVGDGPEKARLQKLAASDQRIKIIDSIDHAKLPVTLSKAHALIMMSSSEGLPLAALEALASGVPVVTTPVGELQRLILPGENGFFVDDSLPEDLLDQVRLIDPQVCAQSVKDYSWKNIAKKIEQLYAEVKK